MVSDFKWNRDIISKTAADLRRSSLRLKAMTKGFHPLVDELKVIEKQISSAAEELEILIVDLATAQREWSVAKGKLQRISGIVSADSEIGKILRGE